MYIDSLTVTAFVVFMIAMVMFVRKCIIRNCVMDDDDGIGSHHDVKAGGKQ